MKEQIETKKVGFWKWLYGGMVKVPQDFKEWRKENIEEFMGIGLIMFAILGWIPVLALATVYPMYALLGLGLYIIGILYGWYKMFGEDC